jgi:Starch-binding associating with outer membrane
MMMAMRWVKVDATAAQTLFMDAYNDAAGHITTNAQSARILNPGGFYNNMFYQYYNVTLRDDYGVTTALMNFLTSTSDKRAGVYGTSTIGFPYGLTRDNAIAFTNTNPGYARVFSAAYKTATTPEYFITAAYVTLLKAEAAQRGWIAGGNAQQLYQDAIKLSWDQWGVAYTPAELAAYYGNANVAFTAGQELNRIAQQYWVTNFPNGWLGFSDWRRTNIPVLTPAPGTSAICVRLNYGPDERNLNPANWAAAAAQYGGNDSQFSPVHWDR